MKLKGLTKLALSGVALAAVAATLGTSTYAWYVANSKATVSGVTGSTSTTTGGNLLLNGLQTQAGSGANDGKNEIIENGNWTNTLALAGLNIKSISNQLLPITKSSTAGQWNNVKNEAVSNGYNYYMFGAWVADNTSGSQAINMKVAISNTSATTGTGAVQGQTCYTTTGAPANAQLNASFKEDAVYALKLDVLYVPLTGAVQETVIADTTTRSSYSLDTARQSDFATAYACKTGFESDGNAHDYYKALSNDYVTNSKIDGGEETTGTFATITENGIPLTLVKGTKYVVLVRYWLDGADNQCFDSCTGQSFQIDLKLEVPAA